VTEVLFYHLQNHPLERVLPNLVEKSGERGWRVVVQAGSEERMDAINTLLWTYRDDSFLAHGMAKDGSPEKQPVYLTTGADNPNQATVRFLVEGADVDDLSGYDRVVYMFDGRIAEAVDAARDSWKRARDAGCEVTYWQQAASGKWERKA